MNSATIQAIRRRKIVEQIEEAVSSHSLTVVSAPTGYGKTTVAREFIETEKERAHYFSVPAESRHAAILWNALWLAMEARGFGAATALRRMGFPASPAQIREAVGILESVPPAVLVLDDYHQCGDAAMTAFLAALVQSQARNRDAGLRLLLFSRTLPDMQLEEMRLKGQTAVFTQELLAFSEPEAQLFFFANGVEDTIQAGSAWKYSEGWAAALWLCLRNSQNRGRLPPSGDIEALLDKAVFSAYAEDDRMFLMQLSLIDAFTAAEAAVLTGDRLAGRRLARLRNHNAFITRDAARSGYQLHSIFREFLQRRLEARPGRDLASLRRRTGECHAARNEFMSAFRFFVLAGRDSDRLRILELLRDKGGEMDVECHREEIHDAVRSIPWSLRLKQPFGQLSYLWLLVNFGNDNRNAATIRETERHFKNAKSIAPKMKKRLLGEVEFLKGALALNDMPAMCRHYAKAAELLDGPSFLQYDGLSWTFSIPHVSSLVLRESGGYRRMLDYAEMNQRNLEKLTGGAVIGGHTAAWAEYYLERGEFDMAEPLLNKIRELAGWRDNTALNLLAMFSGARLLLARGKADEAAAPFAKSAAGIEKTGQYEHIVCHALGHSYILSCLGRAEQAADRLKDVRMFEPHYMVAQIHFFGLIVHGKLMLAKNDYDGLARLLENTPPCLGPLEQLFGRIHKKIFEALLVRKRSGTDAALPLMQEALDLSRPDGIVLLFTEYADAIMPLLRRLRKTCPDDPHLEKIFGMCGSPMRRPAAIRDGGKNLLSPREKETMRQAAKGRSSPVIARSLGVSVETVKTTLASARVKLGANTRAEAVVRFAAIYGRKTTS